VSGGSRVGDRFCVVFRVDLREGLREGLRVDLREGLRADLRFDLRGILRAIYMGSYFRRAFDFNHISITHCVGLCTVAIIGMLFVLSALPATRFMYNCAIPCRSPECAERVKKARDGGYGLKGDPGGRLRSCALTIWEISHVFTHVLLGFFFNLPVSLGISIGFELLEHYCFDCGSWLDLIYNFIGFAIGHALRCGTSKN
jgi:hypothetical protein